MYSGCMNRIKQFSFDIDFPKFTGVTRISKDTIQFDSSIIIIRDTDSKIKKIFELGLVFPDLIYGASTMGDKFEFKKVFCADTLFISNVSEVHFANQNSGTKCFSFLRWHKMMANPYLYMLQLTNDEVTSKTALNVFIEKARVTAFGFCSILN